MRITPLLRLAIVAIATLSSFSSLVRAQAAGDPDVVAVDILSPARDTVIPYGSAFPLRARFLEQQNIIDVVDGRVRVTIRDAAGDLYYLADTIIAELHGDATPTVAGFPLHQGSYDIRRLPPGEYSIRAIARVDNDLNRKNDTATSRFRIQGAHDVSIVSINSPLGNAVFLRDTSVPLQVTVRNNGLSDESNVQLQVRVYDQQHNVVADRGQAITAWRSGETRIIALGAIEVVTLGQYSILATLSPATDEWTRDDTLRSSFTRGLPYDASVQIVTPLREAQIIDDSNWSPQLAVANRGYNDLYNVDIELDLVSNATGEEVARFIQRIDELPAGSPSQTLVVSHFTPNYYVRPGRYSLIAMLHQGADVNATNDVDSVGIHYQLNSEVIIDTILTPANGSMWSTPVIPRYQLSNTTPHTIASANILIQVFDERHMNIYSHMDMVSSVAGFEHRIITSSPFQPTVPGTYTCEIRATTDGAVVPRNPIDTSQFVWGLLGVDTKQVYSSAALYPNPATRQLTVQPVNAEDRVLGVTDILGRPMDCSVIAQSPSAITLDVSPLPPGSYLLRIERSGTLESHIFSKN